MGSLLEIKKTTSQNLYIKKRTNRTMLTRFDKFMLDKITQNQEQIDHVVADYLGSFAPHMLYFESSWQNDLYCKQTVKPFLDHIDSLIPMQPPAAVGHKYFEDGVQVLKKSKSTDGLYRQGLNLAIKTSTSLIKNDSGLKIFREFLHKLEFDGGRKIDAVLDENIPTAAKIEFAENYQRDHHTIRYKSQYPAREHLMMHELVHLYLVIEARKESANQLFLSNQDHKQNYIKSESEWIKKLKRQGFREDSISNVVINLFEGLNRQIYNTPIDLFIEDFLYKEFPDLRPYQFVSLFSMVKEGIQAVTDKKIVEMSPKMTLYCSKIYNIVSGLHFKSLYGVNLISEFNATQSEFKVAERMYEEFMEYRDNREPGEEYELVQNWADDLKLGGLFELISEVEYRTKRTDFDSLLKKIEDDPFDLESDQSSKEKAMEKFQRSQESIGTNMAVVMFMVDALQYFEKLTIDNIKGIAFEIALLGAHGIKPDQDGYKVSLIPDKSFSGYHLLAYYYVSWAISEPDRLDTLRLPFGNEFEIAQQIFKPMK